MRLSKFSLLVIVFLFSLISHHELHPVAAVRLQDLSSAARSTQPMSTSYFKPLPRTTQDAPRVATEQNEGAIAEGTRPNAACAPEDAQQEVTIDLTRETGTDESLPRDADENDDFRTAGERKADRDLRDVPGDSRENGIEVGCILRACVLCK